MPARMGLKKRARYAAVATTAIAVGAGGIAFATAGTGVVHACAGKADGALRLASKCTKRERKVTWNVRGPQGLRGAMGPQGPPGQDGTAGTPGSAAASIMTARTSASIGQEGYFGASGPSTMSDTESNVTILTPAVTTIAQDFTVRDHHTSPSDNTRVYVVRVNGSDSALTCSIVGGASSCADSTHSVAIPPSSEVSIHRAVVVGTGGGADGTDVLASWRATTP